ncbi:helix-turn-helix domain-containing protein [Streptomyces sp. NBC_01304]|uniref:helix-turn-helix domain-containing protein n=1 Tax=Streptomyces sp. NBC_01304 TaxID=2903818 RepID=UPI002E12DAF9|nr:Scr1 family TA system antitoxin-like transcriptional regulator [Streptomyces sp. NBC_01304]
MRTFGAVVRAMREHHGMTREELGAIVHLSKHSVESIERGRRLADQAFADAADAALGGTGAIREAFRNVTRERGLASWFKKWAGLEPRAISLCTYECRMVPGLLQTPAYATTLFTEQLPPLNDNQVEAQLAARAERQELLRERQNTAYSFILEEHLFRRRTGGTEVTLELIDHVLELGELRNVELQVMPLVQEHHAGRDGPIRLLETPENKWFAYCEGQESGQFIAEPKVVSTLQMRYARMRTQALTPEDSQGLLQSIRGAL